MVADWMAGDAVEAAWLDCRMTECRTTGSSGYMHMVSFRHNSQLLKCNSFLVVLSTVLSTFRYTSLKKKMTLRSGREELREMERGLVRPLVTPGIVGQLANII